MNRLRDLLVRRASTDAGLGAERAGSDRLRSTMRRTLDDIIELDRFAADQRLRASREASDRSRAHDRADAPSPSSSAMAERQDADALVRREREDADAAVAAGRQQEESLSAGVKASRLDTDARLATERAGAEVAQATAHDLAAAALARAEADGNRRDDVTGMVAHDLRGALTVVVMCARMIVDETKEESTRQAAEEITQAAGRMERLLTDMLDVTRIDAGTFRIVKRPHDVGELLREVQRAYRDFRLERGVVVRRRPGQVPGLEHGDAVVLAEGAERVGERHRVRPDGQPVTLAHQIVEVAGAGACDERAEHPGGAYV